MTGKWDITYLPKCPDPAAATTGHHVQRPLLLHRRPRQAAGHRAGRAQILRHRGGPEHRQLLRRGHLRLHRHGAAYFDAFEKAGYDLNLQVIEDQFDYSVQCVNNSAPAKWKSPVLDELTKAYNGQSDLDTVLDNMQTIVDEATAAALSK